MKAARTLATAVMWLLTTVLLASALPALWAQQHLVDGRGYADMARRAAADPRLQSAVATELTAQVGRLSPSADATVVSTIAKAYTAGSSFPGQFARANEFVHRWVFSPAVTAGVGPQGRWVIDFAPMLADAAFAQTLYDYGVTVPAAVPIPLSENAPPQLRPGALRNYGKWWPWLSWGLAALTAAAAALTVFTANRRGKALSALGVSALLVGAAGWIGVELAQRHVRAGLDSTAGTARRIAEVLVATARGSMHQWLSVTLVIGAGLVIVGVIVSLLAGLTEHSVQE